MACSIVEAFGEKGKARELDEVLRLEYRSKLLNPKWAEVHPCGLHVHGCTCMCHLWL